MTAEERGSKSWLRSSAERLWTRVLSKLSRGNAGGMRAPGEPQPSQNSGRRGSAKIGVLTVIQEEFEELSSVLGTSTNVPDSTYYVREIDLSNNYELVLKKLSGRGNIVSATGTLEMLEDFRPDYVLLVGIAGGFQGRDDTRLADIVVPNFVEDYEMRKFSEGQTKRRMEPCDQPAYRLRCNIAEPIANSKAWINNIDLKRCPEAGAPQPKVIIGNLIYGQKILGDDDNVYQRQILEEFDNAVAVDMESGGVAGSIYAARVTRHYNPQYLVIRSISDLVNAASNNETRKKWKRFAAHVASVFAATIAERLIELG